MKRLISLFIAIVLLVSVCVFDASAALPPKRMGDLNDDSSVDIMDATLIQSVIAKLYEETKELEYLGDVDQDGDLSVLDATAIQLWLSKLISDEEIDLSYFDTDVYVHDAYPDYESGKAMAGVPVTFTVNAESKVQPLTYALYVDFERVATSNDGKLIYTFDECGSYIVEIDAENIFNDSVNTIANWEYEVVEPYDYVGPEITSAYITGKHVGTVIFGKSGMKVCAETKGGVAPYQYKFELTRPKTAEYNAEEITITQDFSDKNYLELERINYDDICFKDYGHSSCGIPCVVNITVKDANGVEATKTMEFEYSYDYPIG